VVAAGDSAEGVDIPADVNVTAEYPVAVLRDATNTTAARLFLEFITSATGRAILASHGFGAP
jgi:molybdate transport system substrate-binding protein